MNFIRGEHPHYGAQTESGLDYTHISVAGMHFHVAPSRGTLIKAEFRASLGVKRSALMWIRLSRKKAETDQKSGSFEGWRQRLLEGGSKCLQMSTRMSTNVYGGFAKRVCLSRLYHGSIMYLSRRRDYGCLSRTYHVVGTRRQPSA